MIGDILARTATAATGGTIVFIVMMVAYVFIFALIIICLIRVSRYCMTSGKERKLMRMELGKLAEEVHLLRQKLNGKEEGKSPAQPE